MGPQAAKGQPGADGIEETPSPPYYLFSAVGTSRCDVRAACSGATLSIASVAANIRSARYCAGGDGAARHPYHRANHIPSIGWRRGGTLVAPLLGPLPTPASRGEEENRSFKKLAQKAFV